MVATFHLGFIVVYLIGFIYFVTLILRFRARDQAVEQSTGSLPPPPALISWLIPPAVLMTGLGDISVAWLPIRLIGVALALYARGKRLLIPMPQA